MDIIYDYLFKKGFTIIDKKNTDSILCFSYLYTIDGFAEYTINITSYSNWIFRMETEKRSLSNVVVGFSNQTCFLGLISSHDPIQIIDVLFHATGINSILAITNIYKVYNDVQ